MEKLTSTLYSLAGKKVKAIDLAPEVFGNPFKQDLVHQVVTSMMANMRSGTAHTKDRGEVAGGGKKPWKQKGTGRARHASTRSPIWVGGGTTHGPRSEKDYSQKINSKMRLGALVSLLSEKNRTGNVLFTESLEKVEGKTKEGETIVGGWKTVEGFGTLDTKKNINNMLVIVPAATKAILQGFKNLPYAKITTARNVSAYDIAKARYVVVADADSVQDIMLGRWNNLMTKKVSE
ncbi:MAG TPA: 50S ribosomal protein L4 [Candidatus Paceibacterota bacterium]